MRALLALAALVSLGACDWYAYEPLHGRNTGCGGVHFDCTDDVVTDNRTGLQWQRARRIAGNYADAAQQCSDFATAGKFDWRLPTLSELEALEEPLIDDNGYRLDPARSLSMGSLPHFSADTIDDETVRGWSFSNAQSYPGTPATTPPCAASPGPHGETKLYRACSAFFRCLRGGASADGGN